MGIRKTFLLSLLGVAVFGGLMASGGYFLGMQAAAAPESADSPDADHMRSVLQGWVDEERNQLASARRESEDQLDALATRLAKLQAQMMRIDAVGERLVKLADFDRGEFDFSDSPAVGGPEDPEASD